MKPFPFAIYPGEKNNFQLNTFKKSISFDPLRIIRQALGQTYYPQTDFFSQMKSGDFSHPVVQKTIDNIRRGISSGMIIPWTTGVQDYGIFNLPAQGYADLYGIQPGQVPIVSTSDRHLIQLNHRYIDENGNEQSIPLRFYRSTGQGEKPNIPAGKWYFAPVSSSGGTSSGWIGKYTALDSGKSAEQMTQIPISQRRKNGMENSYGNPVIAFYKKWLDDNIGNIGDMYFGNGEHKVFGTKVIDRIFAPSQDSSGLHGLFDADHLKHNPHMQEHFSDIPQQLGIHVENDDFTGKDIDMTLGRIFSYYHDILNNRKAVSPEVDQYRVPGSTHTGYGISQKKMNDMDPKVFPALSRFLAQSEQSQPAQQIDPLEEQLKDATRDFYIKKNNYMRSSGVEGSEKFRAALRAAQKTLLDTFPKAKDTEFGKDLRAYTEAAKTVPLRTKYTPEEVALLTPHIEKIGSALFPKTWKISPIPHEEKIGGMHAHLPPSVESGS